MRNLEDEGDWGEADEEQERLLERFVGWAEQQGADDEVGMAASLLDYKSEDADGNLGRWTADDLRGGCCVARSCDMPKTQLQWWPYSTSASSANATASRRVTGSSTASS
jgi:hypothetical protein